MSSSASQRRAFVIGAGLAGSEAAYQLARRGVSVTLFEMRPETQTPAHKTGGFAELVCSNSLGADRPTSPAGILKQELRAMDSIVMRAADVARVPAGGALAVDRHIFSEHITQTLAQHPNIEVKREELRDFPVGAPVVAAPGPLLAGDLAARLSDAVGNDLLSFFDAAAPIVMLDSVDMTLAYRAGRYGQADDYVNCPLDKDEYYAFVDALVNAERAPLHGADASARYFEGCLPVEVMASRGPDTLRFGPMRPVGLPDPRTGREPFAVVQLRRDDAAGLTCNLVGFQTNLKFGEQARVFGMIPALKDAEFTRYGVMHRNTFVCAPRALDSFMRPCRGGAPYRDDLFLAGQLTGVEGYVESTASGAVAALNLYAMLVDAPMPAWPRETSIGSLLHYLVSAEPETFQPMNVNLGIFPPLPPSSDGRRKKLRKPDRSEAHAARSREALGAFIAERCDLFGDCLDE